MAIAFQLLSIIIVFFIVLAGAYYFTKYVANKTAHTGSGSNLRVIEGISLSKDTSIFIVKVCDKYVVLSNTPNSVSILRELDESQINFQFNNDSLDTSFKKYFTALMNKTKGNVEKINLDEEDIETFEEINKKQKENSDTNNKFNFKDKLNKFTNKNRDDI